MATLSTISATALAEAPNAPLGVVTGDPKVTLIAPQAAGLLYARIVSGGTATETFTVPHNSTAWYVWIENLASNTQTVTYSGSYTILAAQEAGLG